MWGNGELDGWRVDHLAGAGTARRLTRFWDDHLADRNDPRVGNQNLQPDVRWADPLVFSIRSGDQIASRCELSDTNVQSRGNRIPLV
jgi:hypothetical protein